LKLEDGSRLFKGLYRRINIFQITHSSCRCFVFKGYCVG
jgi:hypothetical protein